MAFRYPLLCIAVVAPVLTAGFTGEKPMLELVRGAKPQEGIEPDWINVKVDRKWQEAQDIVCLELVSLAGEVLPPFEAGAFIDLALPGGLIRPYSLTNAPVERHRYVIAVFLERAGFGGSRKIHEEIKAGDFLRIGKPRNEFSLQGGAVYSVLLAGGIGVAPLMTMAEHLWRTGGAFEMHYSFRALARAAFLDRISKSPYASRVHRWCSGSDLAGRLDLAATLKHLPRLSHLYVCGPAGFMGDACRAASREGWAADRVNLESFGASFNPALTRNSGV